MQSSEPLLQISQIVKDYPGVRAVDHASFDLQAGEVHALVGENGAGKSTLVKIMAGVVQPDAGQIYLKGVLTHLRNGQDAYKAGFSFIHQELNLISFLNAPENIFLGHPYPKNQAGLINWKALSQKTLDIFATLGVDIPVNLPAGRLTPGEQSMVAIARAFALDASIYVMDEPTASLSSKEVENLFEVIQTLKSKGRTVFYISHRLEEIFQITDRVTVMRDGKTVGTFKTEDLDKKTLISHMIGRDLTQYYPPATGKPGDVIFEARGAGNQNVSGINFKLHAGEVLGIAGLIGSGRSELLHMLYGLDPVEHGELVLFGKEFSPSSPASSIRQKVVLVPEERRTQGLVMGHSITENIVLPHLHHLARFHTFTSKAKERVISKKLSADVCLKTVSVKNSVSTLSGGNQQKVVFARWMVDDVNVLLLDEPTRGVDVGARFEIYSLIRDMAAKGAGILLVSSDLQEIMGLSDRIVVMREGQLVAEMANENLTKYDILKHAYKAA
jgi:ABC-type sugar transport system ATPase subunit